MWAEHSTFHSLCTKPPQIQSGFLLYSDSGQDSRMRKEAPDCLPSLRSLPLEVCHSPQLEEIQTCQYSFRGAPLKKHYRSPLHLHRQERVHPSLYSDISWFPVPQDDTCREKVVIFSLRFKCIEGYGCEKMNFAYMKYHKVCFLTPDRTRL